MQIDAKKHKNPKKYKITKTNKNAARYNENIKLIFFYKNRKLKKNADRCSSIKNHKSLNEILEDYLVDNITNEQMNISNDEIYFSDTESYINENDQEEIYFSDEESEKTNLYNESKTYSEYETGALVSN